MAGKRSSLLVLAVFLLVLIGFLYVVLPYVVNPVAETNRRVRAAIGRADSLEIFEPSPSGGTRLQRVITDGQQIREVAGLIKYTDENVVVPCTPDYALVFQRKRFPARVLAVLWVKEEGYWQPMWSSFDRGPSPRLWEFIGGPEYMEVMRSKLGLSTSRASGG